MTKKMLQMRNFFLFVLVLENTLLFSFYLLLNKPVLLTFSIYALIKNILIFMFIAYFSFLHEKNIVSVSKALNDDAKNAFLFGGIALIQYDENRNIVWTSDLMRELNINIVGVKLLEWQPHLASLFEDETVKIIDVKGKKFEAYNSQESKLIFLKDVTQYISLRQDYLDQQVCMAYITIDNYEETLENADEPKMALIQSKSRQVIVDWAYNNGIIIRRFKSGGYLAFFNERIYRKQVENKFAILDTFKEMSKELDEVMTLSIGIGRDSHVLRELEDMASAALNLTYSRGGDQVAVKSGDETVKFFGGNSDTFEKSSKVKARVIAQSLAGLIKSSSDILVMGHKNSDLDSFGGSIAAARIAQAYGKKVGIVVDFDSIEQKTKGAALYAKADPRYKGLIITYTEAMERVNKDTLLIIVDNHKPSLAISSALLERVRNKVVIDHHRRGEEFIVAPVLTYLEPAASSTVELIVELCEYQKEEIEINELDATIMYAGMLVDTNNFKQRVGVRTFQCAAFLKELQADVSLAYQFLEDSYEETLKKLTITQTAYRYHDKLLIAHGGNDTEYTQTMLAKASNSLLEVSGIKATFTVGRVAKNKVAISARSSRDVNVQIVMENMGGGGHFGMAACLIEDRSVEEVCQTLEKTIDEYLEDRREL